MPRNNFEVSARGHDNLESRIFSVPGTFRRGIALAQHPTDPDQAVLANDDRAFMGFVTRDITAEGPTALDSIYPGRMETPFKTGGAVGVDSGGIEIEAEGPDVVMISGGRAVAGNTAVGTLLAFQDGKLALATSTKLAFFVLAAQIPPVESANGFRVRARYIGAARA